MTKGIKITLVVILGLVLLVPAVFVLMGIWYFRPFSESEARKRWSETALANSTIYHATIRKAEKTVDDHPRLYLTIREFPGVEFSYECGTSMAGRFCQYNSASIVGTVGSYTHDKHSSEIEEITARYKSIQQHSTISDLWIVNGDTDELTSFAGDIMEIIDYRRLYSAYVEAREKVGLEKAADDFDYIRFIIEDQQRTHKRLFEWMYEQGMR